MVRRGALDDDIEEQVDDLEKMEAIRRVFSQIGGFEKELNRYWRSLVIGFGPGRAATEDIVKFMNVIRDKVKEMAQEMDSKLGIEPDFEL